MQPLEQPSDSRRSVGPYIIEKRLGKGSFATVFRAHHEETQQVVAIKACDLVRSRPQTQKTLDNELDALRRLQHPNITRLLDVVKGRKHIYVVLECCDLGDFHSYLRSHGPLSEDSALYFLKQLLSGLAFLRQNHFMHRDLKPQNLLLMGDKNRPTLKLADFGFAREMQPDLMAATICGSPLYMAPEILNGQRYDEKADLWSVGVILYEMVTGKTPFRGDNVIELQNNIKTLPLTFPKTVTLSPACTSLIKSLLCRDVKERAAYEDVFSDPFVSMPELLGSVPSTTGSLDPVMERPEDPEGSSTMAADQSRDNVDSRHRYVSASPTPLQQELPASPASLHSPADRSGYADAERVSSARSIPLNPFKVPPPFLQGNDVCEPSAGAGVVRQATTSGLTGVPTPTGHTGGALAPSASDEDYEVIGLEGSNKQPLPVDPTFRSPVPAAPQPDVVPVPWRQSPTTSITSATQVPPSTQALEQEKSFKLHQQQQQLALVENQAYQGKVLVELMEHLSSAGKAADALAVGMKALTIITQALQLAGQQMRHFPGQVGLEGLGKLYSALHEVFKTSLEKVEKLRGELDPISELPSAVESVYQFSLAVGKDAAADEILERFRESVAKYQRAYLCLSSIYEDVSHEDRPVLLRYLYNFRRRLDTAYSNITNLDQSRDSQYRSGGRPSVKGGSHYSPQVTP
eukprot:Rmarinus@m.19156